MLLEPTGKWQRYQMTKDISDNLSTRRGSSKATASATPVVARKSAARYQEDR